MNAELTPANVVRRIGARYFVVSGSKRLSIGYATKEKALKRNVRMEYFKDTTQNAKKGFYNGLRADPSRTGISRAKYASEVKRRFLKFKRDLMEFLVKEDDLALNAKKYKFSTASEKRKLFREKVQALMDSSIEQGGEGNPWSGKYVTEAYRKALDKTYTKTTKQKPAEVMAGAKGEFMRASLTGPEALDKVERLASRAFENLKGVTAPMKSELNRILSDGLAGKRSLKAIAKDIAKTLKVSEARALRIARTEMVYVNAEGQLDAMESLGITSVTAEVEFVTAAGQGASDTEMEKLRVCPKCMELSGRKYTISEAHGIIPLHPGCRCSWIPA